MTKKNNGTSLDPETFLQTSAYQKEQGYFAFEDLPADLKAKKREILSTPIQAVDLEKINTVDDLVEAYSHASIQARNIGSCAKVLEQMMTDPDRPTVLLGLAGPLIAAGLRKVIRDMIASGMVDCVVSTGAILYQDLYQAKGFKHFRGSDQLDDGVLRDLYIDRIYDTFVNEEQFWRLDCTIGKFTDSLKPGRYSSRMFLSEIGKTLDDDNSILATAYKKG